MANQKARNVNYTYNPWTEMQMWPQATDIGDTGDPLHCSTLQAINRLAIAATAINRLAAALEASLIAANPPGHQAAGSVELEFRRIPQRTTMVSARLPKR